jgi:hypothetical protein
VISWIGFFPPLDYITTLPLSRPYSVGFDDECFEGSGCGLFEVLPRHLPGRTEETH